MSAPDERKPGPMSPVGADPMDEAPEQDSAAAVAIELLGGATVDQITPEKRKRVPDSAILLMFVVAIAAGGLYFMRQMGLGSTLQFDNVRIDYPLEGIGADGDEGKILADLRDTAFEQVPLSHVQKNPFQLADDGHLVAELPTNDLSVSAEEAQRRREAEQRRQMIVRAYADLELNGVLLGGTPVARISGKTVRVGDVVEGFFKVTSISSREVGLEADGAMYTLSLGE